MMDFVLLMSAWRKLEPTCNVQTLEGFARVIQAEMASVYETFSQSDQVWPHGVLVANCTPEGKMLSIPEIYLFPFVHRNAEEKQARLQDIHNAARQMKAFGIVLVTEAWARFLSAEEAQTGLPFCPPSRDPQRREMVLCTAEFAPEGLGTAWFAEIETSPEGVRSLGAWEQLPGHGEGQLFGLLPPYTPPVLH